MDTLDYGDAFLFVVKTPIEKDNRIYSRVWGTTEYEQIGDVVLVKIGGYCNELILDPLEITYAFVCENPPDADDVLTLGNEHDDFIEDCTSSETPQLTVQP